LADAIRFSIIDIMNRLSKVRVGWSSKFAYSIGLIATDGCLSKDGRHVDFTSKDEELVLKFRKCLGVKNKIGVKFRGNDNFRKTKCFRVQLGDVNFYEFLVKIGLKPAKSKTLEKLMVPKQYFRDFLRGCIDGDGNINIFSHPESKHPQLRVRLYSASLKFLHWMKEEICQNTDIVTGWIEGKRSTRVYKLCFAKEDSIKLLKFIYYNKMECCLSRKYKTARMFLV